MFLGQWTGIISLQFFLGGNALSSQNSTCWNDFSSSLLFAVSLVIIIAIKYISCGEVFRIRYHARGKEEGKLHFFGIAGNVRLKFTSGEKYYVFTFDSS